MRRIFIVVIVVFLPTVVFSSFLGWFTIGPGYEMRTGGDSSSAEPFDAAGFTLTSYSFSNNETVGLFSGVSLNYPIGLGSNKDGSKINFIVGPAVRIRMAPAIIFGGSIGVALSRAIFVDANYTKRWADFGIGLDVTFLLTVTGNLALSLGYMGAYNFYQYTEAESFTTGFHGIDSRPYVGLAVKVSSDNY